MSSVKSVPVPHPAPPLWRFLSLLVGAGLLLGANGRFVLLPAVWLHGLFLLRFSRSVRPWVAFWTLTLVHAVAGYVMWQGLVPIPEGEFLGFCIATGLFSGLVYWLDRRLAPRLGGVLGSLAFPTVTVALGYLGSLGNPFGTWGELAYTQFAWKPVVQVVAVTGIWGLSFIIAWAASLAELAWEQSFRGPTGRRALVLLATTLGGVVLLGQLRLWTAPTGETVRVASVVHAESLESVFRACERSDQACYDSQAAARIADLLGRSAAAFERGARLVVWNEGAVEVRSSQEGALRERAGEVARQHGGYLVMGVVAIPADPNARFENKLVAVAPTGEVEWEYHKSIPVPGEPIAPGEGSLEFLETPFGRVAAMICFDADFPGLARQAGQGGADLLLVAANDWPAIDTLHAEMAALRAVENGVSLLRAASGGVSLAVDSRGRVLGSADHATAGSSALVVDVPSRSARAAYPVIGDLLAWASCVGLLGLLGSAWMKKRRLGATAAGAGTGGGTAESEQVPGSP